jgi:hypothetical protein
MKYRFTTLSATAHGHPLSVRRPMPGHRGEGTVPQPTITTAADARLSMTGRDRVRLPRERSGWSVSVLRCLPASTSAKEPAMMSNTPRVFVGATTMLIAGMTSDAALQTVTAAMNDFPGVRVIAADRITGLVTLNADRPVNRSDLTAAITQIGYAVLA